MKSKLNNIISGAYESKFHKYVLYNWNSVVYFFFNPLFILSVNLRLRGYLSVKVRLSQLPFPTHPLRVCQLFLRPKVFRLGTIEKGFNGHSLSVDDY